MPAGWAHSPMHDDHQSGHRLLNPIRHIFEHLQLCTAGWIEAKIRDLNNVGTENAIAGIEQQQ